MNDFDDGDFKERNILWVDFIGVLVWRKNEFFEAKEIFGFGNVKIEKESGPPRKRKIERCRKE